MPGRAPSPEIRRKRQNFVFNLISFVYLGHWFVHHRVALSVYDRTINNDQFVGEV